MPIIKKLRKKIRVLTYLAALMLVTHISPAQDVYDLNRCISTAIEQNFSLQVVRNREDIASNNFTRGNAGMLPTVTSTNRFGGTINNTTQNLADGSQTGANGIHNTTGSTSVNMGMTIFRGFQVQNTYQKLSHQRDLGGLNTQMSIENLVARIVAEYHYYIQQLTLYENMAYAVSLSRERVRIDEQRYLLGSASKVQYLQSMVYLNADSSRYARQREVLRSSQIRLNKLMAIDDLGQDIALRDSLIRIDEQLLYDNLLNNTIALNTSLQIASKNQTITELDYNIIAARAYPYLTANAGYGYNYAGFQTGNISSQHVRGANYGLTLGFDI